MGDDSKSGRTQIVIAVIGMVGVLGAALIANWGKIVGRGPHTPREDHAVAQQSATTTPQEGAERRTDVPAKTEGERTYKRMSFGFNGCSAKFGGVLRGVTEEEMVRRASAANANGFAFQPSLGFGTLLIGEFPKDCKSPSDLSWPLYLRQ